MEASELILILSVFVLVQIIMYILLFNPRRKVHKIRPEDIVHPETIERLRKQLQKVNDSYNKIQNSLIDESK